MTSQQIGLLFIQLLASISVFGYLLVLVLRSMEERLKYKLFAVRDKLVYLAASGRLSETSMVFKVFYRAMNTYVSELDRLTIVSFVRASIVVKTELEKENGERLIDSLRRSDPEVQGVIDEFFHVVMHALRYNSPLLNIVLLTATYCHRFFSFIRRRRPFGAPVYDTYRFYEAIHGKMGIV
jgi:hypothetical protein